MIASSEKRHAQGWIVRSNRSHHDCETSGQRIVWDRVRCLVTLTRRLVTVLVFGKLCIQDIVFPFYYAAIPIGLMDWSEVQAIPSPELFMPRSTNAMSPYKPGHSRLCVE